MNVPLELQAFSVAVTKKAIISTDPLNSRPESHPVAVQVTKHNQQVDNNRQLGTKLKT